jgi:hypothetical protein
VTLDSPLELRAFGSTNKKMKMDSDRNLHPAPSGKLSSTNPGTSTIQRGTSASFRRAQSLQAPATQKRSQLNSKAPTRSLSHSHSVKETPDIYSPFIMKSIPASAPLIQPSSTPATDPTPAVAAIPDSHSDDGWVPTEPASPADNVDYLSFSAKRTPSARDLEKVDVPIIAPPPGHRPSEPLSERECAKERLRRYVEREERLREEEGLPLPAMPTGTKSQTRTYMSAPTYRRNTKTMMDRIQEKIEMEKRLGIGKRLREEVIKWLLRVWGILSSIHDSFGFLSLRYSFLANWV